VFVDVHSHVVPSGDDGAQSLGEGLALCRAAAERGTSVLYATPHVWPGSGLSAEREERVRAVHAAMAAECAAYGLRLELGFELTPAVELLEEDPRRYRLSGADCVLVELPFTGPLELALAVAGHVEAAGLLPVIAHPERAEAVLGRPDSVLAFAERGWPLQVNATSLLGYHGPGCETAGWRLVESGAAALVASDGHRAARPPFLDDAYAAVRRRVGEGADSLFDGSALGRRVGASGSRPPRSPAGRPGGGGTRPRSAARARA
jgi:protein-tyrosine phosphatase